MSYFRLSSILSKFYKIYKKHTVLKHGYVTKMKAHVNCEILRLSMPWLQPYSSRNTVPALIYENTYAYMYVCENLCVLRTNVIAVHEKKSICFA